MGPHVYIVLVLFCAAARRAEDLPNGKPDRPCENVKWGEWTKCSEECGKGFRKRYKHLEKRECGRANEICLTAKEWENWSPCTNTCGQGNHTRVRKSLITNEECDSETVTCSTAGHWSEWGACSKTCGKGFKKRVKTLTETGDVCKDQTEECVTGGEWLEWSRCEVKEYYDTDKHCGNGTQTRYREKWTLLRADPVLKHKGCDGDTKSCRVVGEWEEWSKCSVTCGVGGLREQSRWVDTDIVVEGKFCHKVRTKACEDLPPCKN